MIENAGWCVLWSIQSNKRVIAQPPAIKPPAIKPIAYVCLVHDWVASAIGVQTGAARQGRLAEGEAASRGQPAIEPTFYHPIFM
ncbi:hypothetical protein RMSM_01666 [Rhodopirellula maiorica SM1]|uniref:Uncharacterized protein n=1 Tax=Rhodopirellula maiorica SM1 TaxID=1265738 RepID=M5S5F8_9BACT|nr:hypothetical protein [Rhodopirellula maiorica]EMI21424.1 hypothetical protein RMSM_01666 [Rhodopirellula maiorica SM1]